MTDYMKYYREHYSKYYNHEAIKRHMIEKKIYSPSDFRYYYYQLSHALKGDTKTSDETLHNLETKYIQDSIDFLFDNKINNTENKFSYIDQFNIVDILDNLNFTKLVDSTQLFIPADQQGDLVEDDNNVSNNVSTTSKEITKKLLNLLSEEQLQELKQIID